ncbi:unknown [Haloarcula marismortui ATCC 43049]|uniref:DUF58 domain-containing protein n=1 Tax=Haloarcula marismortui (strain ATCC 43049 / DSM 3752 / JCM 8966 / VKM B-1809) TaxID=272569 RepID=Q5V3B5_HALMA|nr:DUF58 domain-containing protein [Haloarcula marismortui]AAV45987.1 unknown [Haloarcula marismortui ATCC 43049]QCP90755.1 DUF58 domain-containing protein [Haloarcula marismortui ATCC 43049]
MRVTRRFWLTITAIGSLVVGGGLLDAPLLVVGAVGLAGWLLAMQFAFVRGVSRLEDELTVSQSLDRSRIRTDAETNYTVEASVNAAGDHLPLSIEAQIPLAARMEAGPTPDVDLGASMQSSSVTLPLTWETVGNYTVPGATVTVSDGTGLFTQSFTTGPGPEITVESPSVGPIHVGQSGKRLLRGVGEHDARGRTGGLSAEEIRKYVPGDALKYVDWKATARLDEAHVRNYEAESNRSVVLVLDHRQTLGDGAPGETKLEHLKAVAAAFQQRAEATRDPLGYVTIDDAGVTESRVPVARAEVYRSCQHRIGDLDTETETPPTATTTATHTGTMTGMVNPAADTQSPIEATLLAYRSAAGSKRHLPDQPLYNGLQAAPQEVRSADLLVICTDDSNPNELRNTVGLARRNATEVVVFITPSVAFDTDLLTDLDTAYERYRAFDQFRRELNEIDSVTAYEVGSPDQISAILSGSPANTDQRGSV